MSHAETIPQERVIELLRKERDFLQSELDKSTRKLELLEEYYKTIASYREADEAERAEIMARAVRCWKQIQS